MKTERIRIRRLTQDDAPLLNEFLLEHADTTMFLRGNLERAGFEYEGKRPQAIYVGCFAGERIIGVVGHTWRNSLLLEAPLDLLPDLVEAALAESARGVSGMAGTCSQVKAVRQAFGWQAAPTLIASEEILYRLDLDQLVVPAALASGEHVCRSPQEEDVPLLLQWRADYAVEALGRSREQAQELAANDNPLKSLNSGRLFLLDVGGRTVAHTGFNSQTTDCVQVGGVWTPPMNRSKGYARSVVAGSLLCARGRGITRSILFTEQNNLAAQACYEKLGYQVVGDYMLLDFASEQGAEA